MRAFFKAHRPIERASWPVRADAHRADVTPFVPRPVADGLRLGVLGPAGGQGHTTAVRPFRARVNITPHLFFTTWQGRR